MPLIAFKGEFPTQAAEQLALHFGKAFFQIGPARFILLKDRSVEVNFLLDLFRAGPVDQPGTVGVILASKGRKDGSEDRGRDKQPFDEDLDDRGTWPGSIGGYRFLGQNGEQSGQ